MNIKKAKHIHMIGIGGIGMSALAQLFVREGKEVTGSDRDPSTAVADMLKQKGITTVIGHAAKNVPADADLVIYSDAIVKGLEGYVERTQAEKEGILSLSYFDALGELSKDRFTIAVAGTHGKTTTTGMLVKILSDAEINPTGIVGSIVKDFENNYVAGAKEPFVIEACEYRDHVLKLQPNILVVTNLELDHTDYFKDLDQLQTTFKKAIDALPQKGILVTNPNDPNINPLLDGVSCEVVDYTKESVGKLLLPGEHNRMNAQAAKSAAKAYVPTLTDRSIDVSLEMYQGSWRRFEYVGETAKGAVVYDDYAHHPTAIEKTITTFREEFPNKELTVVFHPHLYSRTKSFFNEFAEALSLADHVIIAPVYAAREKEDKSVSSKKLAEKTKPQKGKALALESFEAIEQYLTDSCDGNDLVVTMGAGDIYKVAEKLTK